MEDNRGEIAYPTIGTYSSNVNCKWIIKIEQGQRVHLNFTRFEVLLFQENAISIIIMFKNFKLDNWGDHLKVFDGSDIDKPEIADLQGTQLPNPIAASGNALTLQFTTDFTHNLAGFSVSYHDGKIFLLKCSVHVVFNCNALLL